MHASSTQARILAAPADIPETRLSGGWLTLARVNGITLIVTTIGLYLLALPAYYTLLNHPDAGRVVISSTRAFL